jgi:hypothetical protein
LFQDDTSRVMDAFQSPRQITLRALTDAEIAGRLIVPTGCTGRTTCDLIEITKATGRFVFRDRATRFNWYGRCIRPGKDSAPKAKRPR